MDIKETAKILDVHTQTIYNMLSDGRLKASKVNGSWDISEKAILEIISEKIKDLKECENRINAKYGFLE